MRAEWAVWGTIALVTAAGLCVIGLRWLPSGAARTRRMALGLLALGGAGVGAVAGILPVMIWYRYTPAAQGCSGCESAWGLIGLAAAIVGASVVAAYAVRIGRRRIVRLGATPQPPMPQA